MTQTFTMAQIAEATDGTLYGDGTLPVTRVVHPSDATGASDLALATDAKLLPLVLSGAAKAAIVGTADGLDGSALKAWIVVKRGRLALAHLTQLFERKITLPSGVHPMAVVEPGAILGEDVAIGPHVYVAAGATIGARTALHPGVYVGADTVIGEDCLLYPGVKIGARIRMGSRCIVHFNASIGSDGFSYVTPQVGSVETAKSSGTVSATNTALVRIASLGTVEIGDDVEIGANTSIDRATLAATKIGNGTKLDNQVQIGHNVEIGENCMLCGRVGVAGSTVIGDRVVLGGAVGVADHVTIGDDAVAMGMSGIAGNVAPRTLVAGIPAMPRAKTLENHLNIGRLKNLMAKVEAMAARLAALEGEPKNG